MPAPVTKQDARHLQRRLSATAAAGMLNATLSKLGRSDRSRRYTGREVAARGRFRNQLRRIRDVDLIVLHVRIQIQICPLFRSDSPVRTFPTSASRSAPYNSTESTEPTPVEMLGAASAAPSFPSRTEYLIAAEY
jgi:hypothetical protein